MKKATKKPRLPRLPKSITLERERVFDVLRHLDALGTGTRPTTADGVRREVRGVAEKLFTVIQMETLAPKDEARIEKQLRRAMAVRS